MELWRDAGRAPLPARHVHGDKGIFWSQPYIDIMRLSTHLHAHIYDQIRSPMRSGNSRAAAAARRDDAGHQTDCV